MRSKKRNWSGLPIHSTGHFGAGRLPWVYGIWLCGKSWTFLSLRFPPSADSVPLLCVWEIWWAYRGEHFPSAFSGSPLEDKPDECKCENLIMFQTLANEEVRKLTQRYILFWFCASVWNAENIIKPSQVQRKSFPWRQEQWAPGKASFSSSLMGSGSQGRAQLSARLNHGAAVGCSGGLSGKASQYPEERNTHVMNSLPLCWEKMEAMSWSEVYQRYSIRSKARCGTKRFQSPSKLQAFPLAPTHTVATFGQCLVSRGLGLGFLFSVWQQRSFISALYDETFHQGNSRIQWFIKTILQIRGMLWNNGEMKI